MDKEQLAARYEKANKALASLEEAIFLMRKYEKEYKKNPTHEIELEYRAHLDSVLKRFEFTSNTVWKYLKSFLEVRFGVVHNSPKPVIRECFRNNLITKQETHLARDIITVCKMSSYIYWDEIAEEIWKHVPNYYNLMHKMLFDMAPKESSLT